MPMAQGGRKGQGTMADIPKLREKLDAIRQAAGRLEKAAKEEETQAIPKDTPTIVTMAYEALKLRMASQLG